MTWSLNPHLNCLLPTQNDNSVLQMKDHEFRLHRKLRESPFESALSRPVNNHPSLSGLSWVSFWSL